MRLYVVHASMLGPPVRQSLHTFVASLHDVFGVACYMQTSADAGAVWTHTYSCPSVLSDQAVLNLLGADDRHSADYWVLWEALAIGLLDADTVLDEHDARAGRQQGSNEGRVIGLVWEGLGSDNDVIPLAHTSCRGGGKDLMRPEDVVAERASTKRHTVARYFLVVRPGSERSEYPLGRLLTLLVSYYCTTGRPGYKGCDRVSHGATERHRSSPRRQRQ
jgi:hypothetical protein